MIQKKGFLRWDGLKVDDEVLICSIPLSFAIPVCWVGLNGQSWGLFFIGLLLGIPALIGMFDSLFLENQLIIRLIGSEREEDED